MEGWECVLVASELEFFDLGWFFRVLSIPTQCVSFSINNYKCCYHAQQ